MSEPIYISDDGEGYMELVTHVNGKRVAVGLPNESSIGLAEKLLLEKVKRLEEESK